MMTKKKTNMEITKTMGLMKKMFDRYQLWIFIIGFILYIDKALAGSCSAAKLCCQGRDSGCVIQKESPNAIIERPRDKPCYCDHACLKLADCCDDFKETCGVVDCIVSEWSDWSTCNTGCGTGTQKRSRSVRISEKNGGKHCPRLDQIRNCRSFQSCHSGILRPLLHDRSVTLLSFLSAGYNGTAVGVGNEVPEIRHKCVAFTIVRASRACKRISSSLAEGTRICVDRLQEDDYIEYNEKKKDGENNNSSTSTNNNNNSNNRITSSIKDDRRRKLLVGIGRWKLSTSVETGSPVRTPMNSSCHGKWIGDSRHLIDCDHPTCKDNNNSTTRLQVERRIRRSLRDKDYYLISKEKDLKDDDYNDKEDNYFRSIKVVRERCRRRRRGRRRKRSKRRRYDFMVKY